MAESGDRDRSCRYVKLQMIGPGWIRLKPNIDIDKRPDGIYSIGDRVLQFPNDKRLRLAFQLLLNRRTGISTLDLANKVGTVLSLVLMRSLQNHRLVQFSRTRFPHSREKNQSYWNTVLDSPVDWKKLRQCRVVIVGCGGLGGELSRHMASSGVGNLELVDGDLVEDRNLTYQYLYVRQDVGKKKVSAACSHLSLINNTRVRGHCVYIKSLDDLKSLNLPWANAVVCCADSLGIDSVVSQYASHQQSLFARASVGLEEGTWGPIVGAGEGHTYHQWYSSLKRSHTKIKTIRLKQHFGPTNSLIAAALARDLLHAIVGEKVPSSDAQITLNFRNLAISTAKMNLASSR